MLYGLLWLVRIPTKATGSPFRSPLPCPEPLYFCLSLNHSSPIHTVLHCDKLWVSIYLLQQMFDSSGHMQCCSVWTSFNQLFSWWLLCKQYAYTLIRVSRHYYVTHILLFCLCTFVSNKAFSDEVEVMAGKGCARSDCERVYVCTRIYPLSSCGCSCQLDSMWSES